MYPDRPTASDSNPTFRSPIEQKGANSMKRFASVLAAGGIALAAAAWSASAALAQADGRASDTPAPALAADFAPDLAADLALDLAPDLALPFASTADRSTDASAAAQAASVSSADLANMLNSRIWWHDYGSFGGYPVGTVYSLGGEGQDGGYMGIKFDFAGRAGNTQRGFAWFPFVRSNSNFGLVIDLAYRQETLTVIGVDAATERLAFRNSNGTTAIWASTRSPYTPAKIRSQFSR